MGGEAATNVIDYITISTPGNSVDFGDLTQARFAGSATSNSTNDRGVLMAGYTTGMRWMTAGILPRQGGMCRQMLNGSNWRCIWG